MCATVHRYQHEALVPPCASSNSEIRNHSHFPSAWMWSSQTRVCHVTPEICIYSQSHCLSCCPWCQCPVNKGKNNSQRPSNCLKTESSLCFHLWCLHTFVKVYNATQETSQGQSRFMCCPLLSSGKCSCSCNKRKRVFSIIKAFTWNLSFAQRWEHGRVLLSTLSTQWEGSGVKSLTEDGQMLLLLWRPQQCFIRNWNGVFQLAVGSV